MWGELYSNPNSCNSVDFGQIFELVGARERQHEAGEAFRKFGNAHRHMAQEGQRLLDRMQPTVKDLSTFIDKAVPDMKLTLEKYRDAKIEFLVRTRMCFAFSTEMNVLDVRTHACTHTHIHT